MKKIMIVHNKLIIGGVERVLLSFLKILESENYEIDLYLKEFGGDFFDELPKNINIYSLKEEAPIFNKGEKNNILIKLIRKIIGVRKYYKLAFRKYYKRKKYDVSISFVGLDKLLDLFAGVAPAERKLIWCHGDFLALSRYTLWFEKTFNIDKYKYLLFDTLIAVSKTSAQNFLQLYNNNYKTNYLWNPIDYKRILKKSKEDTSIVLDGKYNIVCLGRLVEDKAIHMLIMAHEILLKEKYSIKSYIIGDGPKYNDLNKLITQNNLNDSVILLGSQKNPYNIISQADLLVLPSRNEGFPTVLMEALVLGIPFVSTSVCGAVEICNEIAPSKSCILVKNHVDSIKRGIVEAYEGKVQKNYKFDVKAYNEVVHNKLIKIIDGDSDL